MFHYIVAPARCIDLEGLLTFETNCTSATSFRQFLVNISCHSSQRQLISSFANETRRQPYPKMKICPSDLENPCVEIFLITFVFGVCSRWPERFQEINNYIKNTVSFLWSLLFWLYLNIPVITIFLTPYRLHSTSKMKKIYFLLNLSGWWAWK